MPQRAEIYDQAVELPRYQVMVVFFTLGVVFFIATLDTSCVSTALPIIAADLHAGSSITWVGTSLLVASTTTQVIISRLSDIFGRKICLQVSLAIFAFGNLLCGFAQTPAWLYAARGVAGIGAGGVSSLSLIVMGDVVSLRERGKYISLMGIPTALGLGLGPEIGGALADHVSWRWAFWITVPVAAAAMPIIWLLIPLKAVPGSVKEKLKLVDWWGSLFSLAAIVLLLVPISAAGTEFAWSSPAAISMLVIGSVCMLIFLVIEWFHPLPIVPLHLFTNRTVALVLTTMAFVGIVWFGNSYIAPLYFQNVLGYSAVEAGALMLPLLVGQMVVMTGAGYAMKKWGKARSMILGGYLIFTAGQGMQIAWGVDKQLGMLVGALLIQGTGFGLTSQTTLVLAQASCDHADRAVVTGLRNVFRNLGGAVGLAIANAIMNMEYQRRLPALPKDVENTLRSGGFNRGYIFSAPITQQQRDGIIHAYYTGLRDVFIMYAPVIACCFLFCLGCADTSLDDQVQAHPSEESAQELDSREQEESPVPESDASAAGKDKNSPTADEPDEPRSDTDTGGIAKGNAEEAAPKVTLQDSAPLERATTSSSQRFLTRKSSRRRTVTLPENEEEN